MKTSLPAPPPTLVDPSSTRRSAPGGPAHPILPTPGHSLALWVVWFAILGLTFTAAAASEHARIDGKAAHPTRILVNYREAAPGAAQILRQQSLKTRHQPALVPRLAVLEMDVEPAAQAADEAALTRRLNACLEALRGSGQFEYVEPDWEVSVGRVPTAASGTVR